MEQLPVITGADLVDRRGIKVDEDGPRDVFAATSFSEDSVQFSGVVEGSRIRIGTPILLQTVLEEVQLPGTVAQLRAGLSDVEMEDLRYHVAMLKWIVIPIPIFKRRVHLRTLKIGVYIPRL